MATDPFFLPAFVTPEQGEECYVVRGRRVGQWVEITLSRDRREQTHGSESYTSTELMAIRRFEHEDTAGYTAYAERLEDAARYAARGELGYAAHAITEGPRVHVSLVARLLTESGEIRTEIASEHDFEDPDSQIALVQATEKLAELRSLAERLNQNWSEVHQGRLQEIRAAYERADADVKAAGELQSIVESENE